MVLIWGSTWSAIPFQLGVVPEEVSVAYRFALASLALFLYARITGRETRIPRNCYGTVVITGALMFSANYLFTYYAINYVTSGLVAVTFSLIVIINAMFDRVIFKVPFERRLVAASLIGVAGIACLFWPEVSMLNLQDETVYGLLLSLVAVVLASLGNMGAKVSTGRKLPVVAVNAHGMAWGALTSVIVAFALGKNFTFSTEPGYVLSLVYLAVFGSAVAFGCYLALLRIVGTARAAYTAVLFPPVALLFSTVLEEYRWSGLAILGVALIVTGNWLALSRFERNKQ